MKNKKLNNEDIVGLIPAAGKATRLGHIPLSKELYPIGFEVLNGVQSPKTVSSYLLDQMEGAGISSFHFVLRNGKWDIPAYYKGGAEFNRNFSYHIADYSYGVPFSINQAFPFLKKKVVALGFPDILIKPEKIYKELSEKLFDDKETSVVLGLFPSPDPLKWDMVKLDDKKNIQNIFIKAEKGKHLKYAWVVAMWKPLFTEFLNNYINELLSNNSPEELLVSECQLSDIYLSAISKGIKIDTVIFEEGKCMDIGTPERLIKAGAFLETAE